MFLFVGKQKATSRYCGHSGRLGATSLVWKKNMETWQAVAQVDGPASILTFLPPELPSAPPRRVWVTEEMSATIWRRIKKAFWICLAVYLVGMASITLLETTFTHDQWDFDTNTWSKVRSLDLSTLDNMRDILQLVGFALMGLSAALLWHRFKAPPRAV